MGEHEAPPAGPWRIDYADGSGNRYALVADGGLTVAVSYDPVTPATSSTGTYSGGPPRDEVVARTDPRLAALWSALHLACFEPSVARAKGTGAFTLTTTAGERAHVMARGSALAAIDALLATFGRGSEQREEPR